MSAAPVFHIGTSGYSFADWVGPFYPPGTRPARFLEYYAQHFGCVEVNATHYRIPPPATLANLAARTPPGFRFTVKLHASFTHGGALDATAVRAFHDAIAPLEAAGRCHGLLAQFPWAFRRDERTKEHLERLRAAFPDGPLWVEFRHDSWMHPRLPSWLAERGLGYCAVDEPALPHLVPPVAHVTNGIGYVRFHGRNARSWWGSAAPTPRGVERAPSREQLRYDHAYTEAELMEWMGRLATMAREARETYLFFNNCHAGQAAHSARLMQELIERQGRLAGVDGATAER